jgi:hypothetical protein
MNTKKIIRGVPPGQKKPEITRFKEMWRDSLSPEARAFWLQLFCSSATQAECRRQVLIRLKIKLTDDENIAAMRDFDAQLRAEEAEAVAQACEEKRCLEEHPDWSKEQVREDVLRKAYFRSRARGDFTLGLKTVAADVKLESLQLDARKVTALEKKAAAFDAAKEQIKKLRDPKSAMTDADRKAIVDKVDEILGIKR